LLLVLSVLSGEKSVTEAIAQAKISRGLYYQLETRALWAMLSALNPVVSSGATQLSSAMARIAQLQAQVERLEQAKRRTQRLLLLTRKSIRAPVKTLHRGRWPKTLGQPAMPRGGNRSPLSITRVHRSDAPSSTPSGAPSP
jgi:hypothetical protein